MELLTVNEVMEICRVSKGIAYSLIRNINEEMKKDGFIIIRGRVNKSYLLKRLGMVEHGGN